MENIRELLQDTLDTIDNCIDPALDFDDFDPIKERIEAALKEMSNTEKPKDVSKNDNNTEPVRPTQTEDSTVNFEID